MSNITNAGHPAYGGTRKKKSDREILKAVAEYVEYPGNWSALDGRRRILLAMLNGLEVDWTR